MAQKKKQPPMSVMLPAMGVFLSSVAVAGMVIFRLPYVPNWPYVWVVSLAVGIAGGATYGFLMRKQLDAPDHFDGRWLLRMIPLLLAVGVFCMSVTRGFVERYLATEFTEGVVVETYRGDHGSLSIRVDVPGRGIVSCEGISESEWDWLKPGARVKKKCGEYDVKLTSR